MASVFLFAANNSNVEWRFSRYDTGDGDQYALGTAHNPETAISTERMGIKQEDEIASIHSHPGVKLNKEIFSMGWERYSATEVQLRGDSRYIDEGYYKNPIYVYFPASNNIYQVRGIKQPAFIRNITNHQYKAKNLFWGVLNVR